MLTRAVEAGGGRVVEAPEAEALVWTDPHDAGSLARVLGAAPAIRWVQLPFAGVDAFVSMLDDGRTWTSAKGAYSDPVAEHALALGLAGLRLLPHRARARAWGREGGSRLAGARVTVVGGGGITRRLLQLLAPFGVTATVVRRSGRPLERADEVVGPEGLHRALAGARLVFLALALTGATRGIIGRAELAAMDADAWLVNVARGAHVVTDDLVDALAAGSIGGAALDVTDPEPLPEGHPLWTLDNCLITPHTANTSAMSEPLLAGRVADNVGRFAAGLPMVGVVDPALGY